MKKNFQFSIFNFQKGFTLIEIMTAISIFAVVMTISVGSITGIFDANRKARSLKTAISNLNLAIESMSKEMRFGKNYHCGSSGQLSSPRNCPSGETYIYFRASDGNDVAYYQNGTAINKTSGGNTIELTAPEVAIDSLNFYTLGAGLGDTLQPKIIMKVKAHAGSGKSRTDYVLQTMVSQRLPDI